MHRRGLGAALLASLLFFGIFGEAAVADNRVALVIGNGAYVHVPHLPNPSHDAEDVAAALKRTGFQTIVGIDLDQAGMQNAAIQFARAARTADVAMFYYSGHALQFAGVNYMVPIDAELHDEADLRRMTRVDEVVADLQQARNLRILVLDSCRDNPLADQLKRAIGITRSTSIGRGLAKIDSPEGMIVAYATQAGRTAEDGDGRNSPYTAAFLRNVEAKEEIGTIFRRISADVYQGTRQTQLPELSLSLIGEFYLNGRLEVAVTPVSPPAPSDPCAAASDHWKSAEAIGTIDVYQDHLAQFPHCAFAALAKARIASLSNKVAVVTPPTSTAVPPNPMPSASPTVPPVSTPSAPSAAPQNEAPLTGPSDALRLDLVTDCDGLVPDQWDPHHSRGVANVGFRIPHQNLPAAFAACKAAMDEYPEVARFVAARARVALEQQDYALAFQLGKRAAAAGEPVAMMVLSILYGDGRGVAADEAEACKWVEKAAAADYAPAFMFRGMMFRDGAPCGVRDYVEARKWLEKAVAAEVPDAATNLDSLNKLVTQDAKRPGNGSR
jgi:hypothetical protein